jgi:hypothetical protein
VKSLITLETVMAEPHKIWESHTVKLNGITVLRTHVYGAAIDCFTGMRNDPEKLHQFVEDRMEELVEFLQHDLRMGRPAAVKGHAENIIKLVDGLENESTRLAQTDNVK